jgi:hypothetical protein
MARSTRRGRSRKRSGGTDGGPGSNAFERVFEMLGRTAEEKPGPAEARERFSDMVRLAGRLRQLERRLGSRGVAELSPYLQSLLRLVTEPRVVEPARLRRAASF